MEMTPQPVTNQVESGETNVTMPESTEKTDTTMPKKMTRRKKMIILTASLLSIVLLIIVVLLLMMRNNSLLTEQQGNVASQPNIEEQDDNMLSVSPEITEDWTVVESSACNVTFPLPPSTGDYVEEGTPRKLWEFEDNGSGFFEIFNTSARVMYRFEGGAQGSGFVDGAVEVFCQEDYAGNTAFLVNQFKERAEGQIFNGEFNDLGVETLWGFQVNKINFTAGASLNEDGYLFVVNQTAYYVRMINDSETNFLVETTELIFNNLTFIDRTPTAPTPTPQPPVSTNKQVVMRLDNDVATYSLDVTATIPQNSTATKLTDQFTAGLAFTEYEINGSGFRMILTFPYQDSDTKFSNVASLGNVNEFGNVARVKTQGDPGASWMSYTNDNRFNSSQSCATPMNPDLTYPCGMNSLRKSDNSVFKVYCEAADYGTCDNIVRSMTVVRNNN